MKEGLNNNSWFVLCSQEAWASEPLQGFSSAIGFPFLYNLADIIFGLFDYSHSNRHEVISHCVFDLHFLNDTRRVKKLA